MQYIIVYRSIMVGIILFVPTVVHMWGPSYTFFTTAIIKEKGIHDSLS